MSRFRHSLDTVLSVRRRARDSTLAEELNARRATQEKEARALELRQLVLDLEQGMREMMRAGSHLDLRRQELLSRYLASAREKLETALVEFGQAQKAHEQVRLRLRAEAQKVRALERHRETKERQHARAAAAAEHKAQDELWMARIAGRR